MSTAYVEPAPADSTTVFKYDIFKGKALFCTGGGSGICKAMTEAVVREYCIRSVMHGMSLTGVICADEARCECNHSWQKVSPWLSTRHEVLQLMLMCQVGPSPG